MWNASKTCAKIHKIFPPRLENLLIQQGVVAIAKVGLTTEQTALLRETGVVVITTTVDGTDTDIIAETVEEAAEKIVELVRL